MAKLKIGFDFDGVIGDMNEVITEVAARHLGVTLDPKNTENYFLRYCYGGMSLDMEKAIINDSLTFESTKKLKPIDGAIDALKRWQEYSQNKVTIITARESEYVLSPFINTYLEDIDHEIFYGQKKKGEICRMLDLTHFIDDFIFNLIDIANHGILPLLFDQPYNHDLPRRLTKLVTRIYSWSHFNTYYLHWQNS